MVRSCTSPAESNSSNSLRLIFTLFIVMHQVIAWAEHSVEEGRDAQLPRLQNQTPTSTAVMATLAPHSPTLVTPPTSGQVPFQPRPQPHVPNRTSSRCVLPPPSVTLSQWEKDFLAHNKDKIYELLLVSYASCIILRITYYIRANYNILHQGQL